uniref:Peptidase M12A domain-containing protein n=1 Tax=Steinernema glaseri TaxID=37863 RepID=A0A1I7YC99_9BILA
MKPSGTGINHSLVGTDALLRKDSTMTLSDWPGDEQFQRSVLHEIERTQALHNAYDPGSVMHYPIPATFTLNNVAFTGSAQLSDGDKALAGKAYPFTP